MREIFAKAWLFVGHESLVPNPDDYFISRMGTDPVILTRDPQGELHVFLNSCPHRMKLCRYDHGNNRTFTCPYMVGASPPTGASSNSLVHSSVFPASPPTTTGAQQEGLGPETRGTHAQLQGLHLGHGMPTP